MSSKTKIVVLCACDEEAKEFLAHRRDDCREVLVVSFPRLIQQVIHRFCRSLASPVRGSSSTSRWAELKEVVGSSLSDGCPDATASEGHEKELWQRLTPIVAASLSAWQTFQAQETLHRPTANACHWPPKGGKHCDAMASRSDQSEDVGESFDMIEFRNRLKQGGEQDQPGTRRP